MRKVKKKEILRNYIQAYREKLNEEICKQSSSIFPNFLVGPKLIRIIFALDAVVVLQYKADEEKIVFENYNSNYSTVIRENTLCNGFKISISFENKNGFILRAGKMTFYGDDGDNHEVILGYSEWDNLIVVSNDEVIKLTTDSSIKEAITDATAFIILDRLHLENTQNEIYENKELAYQKLKDVLDEFQILLDDDLEESYYHNYLKKNPFLLDIYAQQVHSKYKFYYPKDEITHTGKEYVEPDFIIVYTGEKYKLVELERPNKDFTTKSGQQRAQITQASFQIDEWEDYLSKFYMIIKDDFPGINHSRAYELIVSRTNEKSLGNTSEEYLKLITATKQRNVEYSTYDSIINKNITLLRNLSSILDSK